METLRANKPVISEVRTFTKSGQLRWVRVYAHPVWDAERNQMVGIYGAVQDITRRKQAEEEIFKFSERKRTAAQRSASSRQEQHASHRQYVKFAIGASQ